MKTVHAFKASDRCEVIKIGAFTHVAWTKHV